MPNVLLILTQPSEDAEGMTCFLSNDVFIAHCVRRANSSVVVYIRSSHPTTVNRYISSVYSLLWDEMVQQEKIHLQCHVISEETGGNEKLLKCLELTPFDVVLCHGLTEIEPDLFSSMEVEDLSSIAVEFGDAEVYFFDAPGDIPRLGKLALGGSFDQLHNGHRKLLTLASTICTDEMTIGVMPNSMLQTKKLADQIETFEERVNILREFLRIIQCQPSLNIVELQDPFGPTITDPTIEGIIVSSETIKGALKINEIRRNKEMTPLKIFVTRRSDGSVLSSSFIREQRAKRVKV